MPTHRSRPVVRWLATAALLVAAPGSAWAERWYTVELIAFEQLGEAGLYAEHWPEAPGEPDVFGAIELVDATALPAGDEPGRGGPLAFQMLTPDRFQLHGVWTQLRRSRGYRPLLHVGWHQPGYGPRGARPVHLRAWRGDAGLAGAALDGIVRVHRQKFLHVQTDLLYRPETLTPVAAGTSSGYPAPPGPTAVRIQSTRRMRSRELHYVDHPLVGLIMLITPYVAPGQPEPSDDTPETASGGG